MNKSISIKMAKDMKVKNRKQKKASYVGRWLIFIILFCVVIPFAVGRSSVGIINASLKPAGNSDASSDQTMENSMDTLLLLQESEWKDLPVDERLDVLQTVVNIEKNNLGMSTDLNLRAASLKQGLSGYYSDSRQEIVVNLETLKDAAAQEMLEVVCHEVRHGYQHRLVDAFRSVDDAYKELSVFSDAKVYEEELSNYIDGNGGKDEMWDYYQQDVERDARNYAESCVEKYFVRINVYIEGESEPESVNHSSLVR